MVLGIGLGGFFDGIVFHQLLQCHHMLTAHGDYPMSTVPGLEVNTTWDGIFHGATWIATVAGLWLLWRLDRSYDVRWSRPLLGALLMGWGGFNLVEGIIDHHILTIHHVRDDLGGPLGWDLGFLAWGAIFLAAGWYLAQTPTRDIGLAEGPRVRPSSIPVQPDPTHAHAQSAGSPRRNRRSRSRR
jgi:uncharacterized membrane protein